MDYRTVSEKIAFDGTGYSCRICGRAGYSSMASIKGHLSRCPARQIRAPAQPQLAAASWRLAGGPDMTVSSAPPQLAAASRSWDEPYAPAHESQVASQLAEEIRELRSEVGTLKNEYSHVMEERALGTKASFGGSDWVQRYKPLLIVGGLLLGLFLISNNSRSCPSVAGSTNKGLTAKSLMERGVTKLADKGMTKMVDNLLR